ncbi:glycoside hydrolase family 79 protein [Punctularia strigosozonata HHB-11173 SS5]|uniref:Glycoside hydrolase family 79 protein n=1 Tax=Punctularia strigosozonata (strain HHB-11173) TaxID=741275 RepID=R7S4X3_PUNST|nr:glycoside hydrolase family 79 protein [Punctularia strigosozonata HHB-11173 SS5]EIN04939.1 glycoside hydrolase family 79 protein [Punctularia strigosozonata HHB-11173 SS5]
MRAVTFTALISGAAAATTTVSVVVPTYAPAGAPTVSPGLISYSIEQDRWTDWVGTTSPNQFFFNVLDNVKQITGHAPWLRVGADSEDHTVFDPSVPFEEAVFPAISTTVPYPEATNITVGNGFYQAIAHVPSGTQVIFGLNLGLNNVTNAIDEANSIRAVFNSPPVKAAGITLDFLEIGNEADLYKNNGLRNSSYSPANYVADWTAIATNVTNDLHLTPSGPGPKFVGAAFAGSSHTTGSFSPQAIFADGILNTAPGKVIKTISQHHYSGSFCSGNGGLLQDLMTKATIRSNLTEYNADIAAVHAQGLSYILGETNSYACHGAPNVSNTAGAALWLLDYSLYASQIGIERLHIHNGIGYKYNLVQPVALNRSILDGSPLLEPLLPHVQPAYYAQIIAAEALGRSGRTRVAELNVSSPTLAGYAFYEGAVIKRAVFINSKAFFATSTTRNVAHVDLTGLSASKTAIVKRLTIQHADDAGGLTWGGQTYETRDGRVGGTLSLQTVKVGEGVDIQDTEVVLLSFA